MPTSIVNLSTTAYVKVNSASGPILLQSLRDTVRIALSAVQPIRSNTVFHTLNGSDSPLQLFDLDVDIWALATTDRCSLVVTETGPAQVGLYDAFGNGIGSLDGAINVHSADPHRQQFNQFLHYDTTTTTNPSVAVTAGDNQITFADVTGFAVLDDVKIENGNVEPNFFVIRSIVGGPINAVVTVDTPVTFDHPTSASITKIYTNISQTGLTAGATLAAPISFTSHIPANRIVHITNMSVVMTDNAAMDFTTFGGLTALPNGCVLRAQSNGQVGSYTNWKSNDDLNSDAFPVVYQTKVGGGEYGLSATYNIKDSTESIVYLDGSQGDAFELLVQDPLDTMTKFKIKLQGHYEGV